MKLSIKVKDIPQILKAVEKIRERETSMCSMLGMYTTIDPMDVIHKLQYIDKNNKNLYCPNGPDYSWGAISQEVELSYEEYGVVVTILRVVRNILENKDMWYLP